MKKTILHASASIFLLLAASCSQVPDRELLELDDVLAQKPTYETIFRNRVDVLESLLAAQSDPEQIYIINTRLAEENRSYCFDSTLMFLNANRELAVRMGDRQKIIDSDLRLIENYAKAGYFLEGSDIALRYSISDIPESMHQQYYKVMHSLYGESMAYSNSQEAREERVALRDSCCDVLLELVQPSTLLWYELKYEVAERNGQRDSMKHFAACMETLAPENTKDYAMAAYYMAASNSDDHALQVHWLIQSAKADAQCAVKDYASLNLLAREVFHMGDTERSFRYVTRHCLPDANFFNGILRPWQLAQFLPEIENEYIRKENLHKRSITIMLGIVSALVIALLTLFMLLARRHRAIAQVRDRLQESHDEVDRKNRELTEINDRISAVNLQLEEADKIKQGYITSFLSILSDGIDKNRQYKNHVSKCLHTGKARQLLEELEEGTVHDSDVNEFYKMFDDTFINLYPDFVERFNELLEEGEEIVPKGGELLTPELRIFALIKLGITESNRIAQLLHYSANTIYNYRAKTKNKARGDRALFEDKVRQIS